MFLRYAYSPTFGKGWAVGVQVDTETVDGIDSESIEEAFIYTTPLERGACVLSSQLSEIVTTTLVPAEMDDRDLADFSGGVAEISLAPAIYPWVSRDGALSSLAVDAGDSFLTAQWNTEHPKAWVGLEDLHSLLKAFFAKYS